MAGINDLDFDGILGALHDAWDPETRLSAAAALARWLSGTVADPSRIQAAMQAQPGLVVALVGALGDRHKGVQVHVADCLEVLAHFSPEVLPALRQTLQSADNWHAWGAAIVLARMGIWSEEMGPALSGAMGSHNRDVRWAAANLVLQLAEQHGSDLTDLAVQALASDEATRRKMAAYLVGEMGRRGQLDVEPKLAPLLADRDRDVRRATILALDRQQKGFSPQVRERLQHMAAADPDEFVRRTAAGVLSKYE